MSGHRFYVGESLAPLNPDDAIELRGRVAHRISTVLRLGRGAGVSVFGSGREFQAIIEAVGPSVHLRLQAELPPIASQTPQLTLYQGLIRPSRFEWVLEKGTELGIGAFVPTRTERTTVRAAEIGAGRRERWERIAIEATEQSGGRHPPSIAGPVRFDEALAKAGPEPVLAWEGLRRPPRAAERARLRDRTGGLSLFVGPEGGFSEAEVATAREAGAVLIGLGPRTLRAETAAIAAATLLLLG